MCLMRFVLPPILFFQRSEDFNKDWNRQSWLLSSLRQNPQSRAIKAKSVSFFDIAKELLAFRSSFGYHISQKLPSNQLKCVKRQETRVQRTNPAYLSVARRDVLASRALMEFWRLLSAQIADKCFSDSESSFVCEKFESILPIQGERIF